MEVQEGLKPGQTVRWSNGSNWVQGVLVTSRLQDAGYYIIKARSSSESENLIFQPILLHRDCNGRLESCDVASTPTDPLDVKYDGVTLRVLLERDRACRQEERVSVWRLFSRPTTAQRAAVSAHWSAELRAKVAASKEREHNQVTMEQDVNHTKGTK